MMFGQTTTPAIDTNDMQSLQIHLVGTFLTMYQCKVYIYTQYISINAINIYILTQVSTGRLCPACQLSREVVGRRFVGACALQLAFVLARRMSIMRILSQVIFSLQSCERCILVQTAMTKKKGVRYQVPVIVTNPSTCLNKEKEYERTRWW